MNKPFQRSARNIDSLIARRKQFMLSEAQNASAQQIKLPSLGTVIENAAGAAGRVMSAASKGQPVQVNDAEFQRRMNICVPCEFFIKESQRCSKCACFLTSALIGKARLATEKCPVSKW